MRRSLNLGAGVGMALAAVLVSAVPALGECGLQVNKFPKYTEVAPTADLVVIGTVVRGFAEPGNSTPVFRLLVDEVVTGRAPQTLVVESLRSGLPLRGAPDCRRDAVLYANVGDVLAIAFGGRFDGQHDVNTVAWIEGRSDRDMLPGVQALSLEQARRAAEALPPTDSASVSGNETARPGFAWLMASRAGILAGALFFVRRRRPA
ncbi:MAG: hypothetical protein LH650_10835 [Chloroflexi bacterium]|nr:hypothetical protein [Chloroflexota bacterium]